MTSYSFPRLPLSGARQANADPAPDAILFDLYREWLALLPVLNKEGVNMEAPDWNEGFDRLREIETQVAAAPPRTLQGYAIKIIVADDRGSMNDSAEQLALVAEARAMLTALGTPAAATPAQPKGPAPSADKGCESDYCEWPMAQTDLALNTVRGVMDALLTLSYAVGAIGIHDTDERRQRNGLCAVVEAMDTGIANLIKVFDADLAKVRRS